ncbi:hypothetical protein AR691_17420 [Bacillus amyloliquefaciens]|nr:hypothetical protein AR691_17420 [Bacillus amyloliquefaciens]
MYISLYELKKKITDYQVELLLRLNSNGRIVTTEGSNFKVWFESAGQVREHVRVRRDVANKLLSFGLIEHVRDQNKRYFYYSISKRGLGLLGNLGDPRIQEIKAKIARKDSHLQ